MNIMILTCLKIPLCYLRVKRNQILFTEIGDVYLFSDVYLLFIKYLTIESNKLLFLLNLSHFLYPTEIKRYRLREKICVLKVSHCIGLNLFDIEHS